MKKLISTLLIAVTLLLILSSCDAPGTYKISDLLPPLMDAKTAYPYITSVDVVRESDGECVTLTGGGIDTVRMQLEGIKGSRKKDDGSFPPTYTVTFHTTDSDITFGLADKYNLTHDGYIYLIIYSSVDMVYFDSLFTE